MLTGRFWRYQRDNQNPYIEGQTTQWTKDKMTNNYLQSNTQKIKDRAARSPLNTGGEHRCSEG